MDGDAARKCFWLRLITLLIFNSSKALWISDEQSTRGCQVVKKPSSLCLVHHTDTLWKGAANHLNKNPFSTVLPFTSADLMIILRSHPSLKTLMIAPAFVIALANFCRHLSWRVRRP